MNAIINKPEQPLINKNILLVDDNRDSVQYYLEELQFNGATVTFARNLKEALAYISDNNPPLDFILIDLNIPTDIVPPELRNEIVKWGNSHGQALGQFLIQQKKNIPYRYLSVVPHVFKPSENEDATLVWNKAKYTPQKLAEEVVLIFPPQPSPGPVSNVHA